MQRLRATLRRPSTLALLAFLLFGLHGSGAQTTVLGVSPSLGLPLTPAATYSLSAGGGLELRLGGPGSLEGLARLDYAALVIDQGVGTVSVVKAGAGLGLRLIKSGAFAFGPTLYAGGYGAFRSGYAALFNPLVGASLRAEIDLGGLKLALEPGYEVLVALRSGQFEPFLTQAGLRIGFALAPTSPANHKPLLRIEDPSLDPFFPIIYKSYATKAIGMAGLLNGERKAITDVMVNVYAPSYMDGPQTVANYPSLKPGEKVQVPLTALMKNSALGITESDSAQTKVQVVYTMDKQTYTVDWTGNLKMEGRNAITWDDDQVAAAFITAKDPTVLKFARNMAASLPKSGAAIPSDHLKAGAMVYQALEDYGLRYVVDPTGSYATKKGKTQAVDYLQFPVETLAYRTGDCDDLSTLYNALLESIGLETAYITVPGHIYCAFALQEDSRTAASILADPASFIVEAGKVWIPVEATAIGKGFAAAWSMGATQWQEASRAKAASLIPVHDAWKRYEPSFISSGERSDVVARIPDPATVAKKYSAFMRDLAESQLQVLALRTGGQAAKATPSAKNKLGTLYARYGVLDKAEAAFKEAAAAGSTSALYNLGNIRYLAKDYTGAIDYYRKALKAQPEFADASLGLSRALYDSGKAAEAAVAWNAANKLAPDRAAVFSYIAGVAGGDSAARAADPSLRQAVTWTDEK